MLWEIRREWRKERRSPCSFVLASDRHGVVVLWSPVIATSRHHLAIEHVCGDSLITQPEDVSNGAVVIRGGTNVWKAGKESDS